MSRVKLKDVAVEAKGKHEPDGGVTTKTVGLEHLTPSDIDLQNWAEDADTTFTKGFKAGDILFGRRRAYQKKAAIAPFDGVCSGDITVIRAKEGAIDKDLLPFVIQSDRLFDFAMGKSAGSMSPRVKWSSLGEFEFELPDVEKQHEIARILWAIQDLRRVYKAIIRESENVINSRFVEFFGNPIENERGWQETSLLGALKPGRSVSYGIVKFGEEYEGDDGVPVFRPVDIAGGNRPTRAELKLTAPEISARYKRTLLAGNELLVTVRGSIGETLQIDEEFAGCNVGRNIVPLVTNDSLIRQKYLEHLLHQDAVVDWLATITKGIALQGLNMGEFKKMRVIIPPMQLQDEFIDFAAQIDKSKCATQNALDSLDATSNAILNEELGLENG